MFTRSFRCARDGAPLELTVSGVSSSRPTPTVGSAGTETMDISKGSHEIATSHGPVNFPLELISPEVTRSHVFTRYPTDTPFRVPLLTFWYMVSAASSESKTTTALPLSPSSHARSMRPRTSSRSWLKSRTPISLRRVRSTAPGLWSRISMPKKRLYGSSDENDSSKRRSFPSPSRARICPLISLLRS